MSTAPRSWARGVRSELEARSNPERRSKAASYFPTELEVYGVPVPKMREVLRPLARALKKDEPAVVLAVARAIVDTGVHEGRQIAYELLGGRPDIVATLDRSTLEELGEGNDNWASVDGFAVYLAGPAWRDGKVRDPDVRRWARSRDRWWRRTALVSTVPLNVKARGGTGDARRTLSICEMLVADRDPMVVKALSWALRALVPVDARAVETFLGRHGEHVAPLVRREVGAKLRTGKKR